MPEVPIKTLDRWSIYALSDPAEEQIVRYVGMSRNPQARLLSHIQIAPNQASHLYEWIRSLFDRGVVPSMIILESGLRTGLEAEKKWIQHYKAMGFPLLNVIHFKTSKAKASRSFKLSEVALKLIAQGARRERVTKTAFVESLIRAQTSELELE